MSTLVFRRYRSTLVFYDYELVRNEFFRNDESKEINLRALLKIKCLSIVCAI